MADSFTGCNRDNDLRFRVKPLKVETMVKTGGVFRDR
jgi:hypothetical protein